MNGAVFTNTFPWVLPIGQFFLALILVLLFAVTVNALQSREWNKQKLALADWKFDAAYKQAVLLKYPHLNDSNVTEAFEQLRNYFYVCWRDETKSFTVSSQLLDECWLVFIRDSRKYFQFCDTVFGYYLQRIPPCAR